LSQISHRRASIDWDEVRSRLQKSQEALRESLSDNPQRMQAVLRRRAVQLAQEPPAETRPASRSIPALVFRLGQERYAIPLADLAEVLPFRGCTEVPGGSARFLGVINLRGEIRPVIDLARVLCGNASTDSGAILMLRRPVGLKVDEVENLQQVCSDEMAPMIPGHHVRRFVSGTLALLDVETLLLAMTSAKESRPLSR
jgi:purine-binding chemotaxis protein CheW